MQCQLRDRLYGNHDVKMKCQFPCWKIFFLPSFNLASVVIPQCWCPLKKGGIKVPFWTFSKFFFFFFLPIRKISGFNQALNSIDLELIISFLFSLIYFMLKRGSGEAENFKRDQMWLNLLPNFMERQYSQGLSAWAREPDCLAVCDSWLSLW